MENNIRQLPPEQLRQMLPKVIAEGGTMPLVISGDSMYPFLKHGRDTVYLTAPVRPARPGDLLLYLRGQSLVLHRVTAVEEDGITFLGDRQVQKEPGVDPACVIAAVSAVNRKGKVLRPGNFTWDFYEKIWRRLIPLRPYLIRIYDIFHR